MNLVRTTLAAVTAATVLLGLGGSVAHARPGAVLGGGSGIELNDQIFGPVLCSLTAIGHDRTGNLVGLTAGHCADWLHPIGTPVKAERAMGLGVIGTVVAENSFDDWSVIQFDPAKVIPVRTVGNTTIAGMASFPGPGGWVCDDGRTSGSDCGVVWGFYHGYEVSQNCVRPGDSGGPMLAGDRLVGMVQAYMTKFRPKGSPFGVTFTECRTAADPMHSPALSTSMDVIMGEINAMGGVGTGFQPI